jgi:hypothetical protein
MPSHLRLVVNVEEPKGGIPNNFQRAEAPPVSGTGRTDATAYTLIFLVLLITSLWVGFLGWLMMKLAGLLLTLGVDWSSALASRSPG